MRWLVPCMSLCICLLKLPGLLDLTRNSSWWSEAQNFLLSTDLILYWCSSNGLLSTEAASKADFAKPAWPWNSQTVESIVCRWLYFFGQTYRRKQPHLLQVRYNLWFTIVILLIYVHVNNDSIPNTDHRTLALPAHCLPSFELYFPSLQI